MASFDTVFNETGVSKTTWGINNFWYMQNHKCTQIIGAVDRGKGWRHIGMMIVVHNKNGRYEKMENCTAYNRFVVARFVIPMTFTIVMIMLGGFMTLVIAGMIFGNFLMLGNYEINDISLTNCVTVTSG